MGRSGQLHGGAADAAEASPNQPVDVPVRAVELAPLGKSRFILKYAFWCLLRGHSNQEQCIIQPPYLYPPRPCTMRPPQDATNAFGCGFRGPVSVQRATRVSTQAARGPERPQQGHQWDGSVPRGGFTSAIRDCARVQVGLGRIRL